MEGLSFLECNQNPVILARHAGRGQLLRLTPRHSLGCERHQLRLLHRRLRECQPHAVLAPTGHAQLHCDGMRKGVLTNPVGPLQGKGDQCA